MKDQDLGTIIRNARKKQGKTLKEFADEIGIDTSTLQKYETGVIKNIPYDKLKKISIITNATIPIAGTVLGLAGLMGSIVGGAALGTGTVIATTLKKVQKNNESDIYDILDELIFFFRNTKINQKLKDEIFEQLQKEYFKNKYS